MRNKKGDKLISIYWFLILGIVATGIVVMVNSYYGTPYDVREIELDLMNQKVSDCIYFGGEVNSLLVDEEGNFLPEFESDFLKNCGLVFNVPRDGERIEYYVETNFFLEGDKSQKVYEFKAGNLNWKGDCREEVEDKERMAKCLEKEFFIVDSKGKMYLVNVLTIVGKVDENVK